MNPRVLPGLLWLSLVSVSAACGPFFPDTVLDKPQAALDVPTVSYLGELHRMAGTPMPTRSEEAADSPFLAQIPLEAAQLRGGWQAAGIPENEIVKRLEHYTAVREKLLTGIESAGLMKFPSVNGEAGQLPERPLGREYPPEVADYVEAARLNGIGQVQQARTLWKAILGRRAEERQLRGAWAAWMLAKTSADEPECLRWYERVEKETADGAADILNLSAAAKSWRAPTLPDPLDSLRLFYDAFRTGKEGAVLDIRLATRKILAEINPGVLEKAAADPIIRRLLNLDLQATFDSDYQRQRLAEGLVPPELRAPANDHAGDQDPDDQPDPELPDEWLKALEHHASLPLDEGARLAWALYSQGRYDEARHWLDLSPSEDPLSQWLEAKFDLRSGNLEAANRRLSSAIGICSKRSDWHPGNPYLESYWSEGGSELLQSCQGRLLADQGIIALARREYPAALESLRHGGYDEDAAYVAEHLFSCDELMKHVQAVAPRWQEKPVTPSSGPSPADEETDSATPSDSKPVDPATCLAIENVGNYAWTRTPDNRLRYELARRLAREDRLDEAAPFMPPVLARVFDHYRALDKARLSGSYTGEALAAIIWREARLHRHWGAELFSTDSAPDGGIHEWEYEATDFGDMRSNVDGWSTSDEEPFITGASELDVDRATPRVTQDEAGRNRGHRITPNHRYHYRYVAAALAWKAAEALPDNHPLLAALYNTTGQWLAARDPEAADPLYQAMVKRCKETEAGKAADKRRWFLPDIESLRDLPGMPPELIPKG